MTSTSAWSARLPSTPVPTSARSRTDPGSLGDSDRTSRSERRSVFSPDRIRESRRRAVAETGSRRYDAVRSRREAPAPRPARRLLAPAFTLRALARSTCRLFERFRDDQYTKFMVEPRALHALKCRCLSGVRDFFTPIRIRKTANFPRRCRHFRRFHPKAGRRRPNGRAGQKKLGGRHE